MILKLVFLIGLVTVINAKSFENYKVYSVIPSNEVEVQMLNNLEENGYDFWTDGYGVGSDVRVMVSPDRVEEFESYSKAVGFDTQVRISNVQELIDAQLVPSEETVGRSTLGTFTWTRYHTLAEIHAWLDELQVLYPNIVTPITIGNSNENRAIKGVIIDFKAGEREGKPLVGMIEGGIHAREWISPATVTWIIKEFLTSTDQEIRTMAETFVWHIFPVANPDGYVYTFTDNRMWRKNRNTAYFTNCTSSNAEDDLSNGIDLNRNFDFFWMTTGASSNPCSNTYAGPNGNSEPEARAIVNYVLQLKEDGDFIYYFAFHSYSQMVLVPYSHASGLGKLEAGNYADMYEVAIRGAERLTSVHGTPYRVGTSAEILYEVSGSSFDWVKGVADIPIVFLFELRDVGEFGFLLPTSQIIPNNEEIMASLVAMDHATRDLRYYSGASSVFMSISLVLSVASLVLFK